jgi:superfamily II DNA or RNA helicase
VAALLRIIRDTLSADADAKFVVFTKDSSGLVIRHLGAVLSQEGIGHAAIHSGIKAPERSQALTSFNTEPGVKVFLLSVGQGARGLTLTVASTIVMMEPAESAAEEAQAMNRCHRIGQDKPVRFITLYARQTVEERMLSLRQHKGDFKVRTKVGPQHGAGSGAGAYTGAGATSAAGAGPAIASREVGGPSCGANCGAGVADEDTAEEVSYLQELNSVTWSPAELRYLAGLGSEHLIAVRS